MRVEQATHQKIEFSRATFPSNLDNSVNDNSIFNKKLVEIFCNLVDASSFFTPPPTPPHPPY